MTECGERIRDPGDGPEGDSGAKDPPLDPRIQKEIDKLNLAGAETNRLENELDEARTKYKSIISEMSNRMEDMSHAQKKSIQRAREYYKLKGEANIAQSEALKAARLFQSANGVYNAAKETVALAECRLIENGDMAATQLTAAWQDMLNHAINKVMVAEKEKSRSEQEHRKRASRFAELEGRIQFLEKKYKASIRRSRPYFELKADLDLKLMQQKQNVNDLQATIKANKIKYTEALRKLEQISEEIHQSRRSEIMSLFPRMPGVGAERGSRASSLTDLDYDPSDLLYDSTTDDEDAETDSLSLESIDNIMAKDIQNMEMAPAMGSRINVETDKTDYKEVENATEDRTADTYAQCCESNKQLESIHTISIIDKEVCDRQTNHTGELDCGTKTCNNNHTNDMSNICDKGTIRGSSHDKGISHDEGTINDEATINGKDTSNNKDAIHDKDNSGNKGTSHDKGTSSDEDSSHNIGTSCNKITMCDKGTRPDKSNISDRGTCHETVAGCDTTEDKINNEASRDECAINSNKGCNYSNDCNKADIGIMPIPDVDDCKGDMRSVERPALLGAEDDR